jgi:hypothetical protein
MNKARADRTRSVPDEFHDRLREAQERIEAALEAFLTATSRDGETL